MTPKFVLFGIGAAAVTSIAVPVSLAKAKKITNDETLSADKELEAILDDAARSIRKELNDTQKLSFDQEYKRWHKNKNRKQTEIYSNYFLDSSGNQVEWESNFNSLKTLHNSEPKIVYYSKGEPNVNITQAWNSNPEAAYDLNSTSLNIFCKQKRDDLSEELLWKLCSFFQEKPVTVFQGKRDESLNSENQIGSVFKFLLIATNDNTSFWTKRQEEWQNLKPNNSTHFKYAANKQIKDLCKAAYSKNVDTTNVAFQEEVLKYCSLEWNS